MFGHKYAKHVKNKIQKSLGTLEDVTKYHDLEHTVDVLCGNLAVFKAIKEGSSLIIFPSVSSW